MSLARIGFVMPAWNAAEWIEDALASVLRQTSSEWSLVVVNDGSTDGTLARVNAFLRRRARYWVASGTALVITREHKGLVAAVAEGMAHYAQIAEHLRPAYVGLLAADDYLADDYVQRMLTALLAHPEAPCAYPMIHEFGARACQWTPPTWAPRRVLTETTLPGCAVWRRNVWQRLGGFDAEFRHGWEDWDLAARAEASGFFTAETPPLFVPDAAYWHRAHASSLSDTMTAEYKVWARARIQTRLAPPPLPAHFPGAAATIISGPYDLD